MGMFDYAICKGPEFVCSEGHDLTDCEFQTKDFACVLGYVMIEDGRWWTTNGLVGEVGEPESPTFTVYTSCHRCPVFVQAKTANLCDVCCEFEIVTDGDRVLSARRISETTADFIAREPNEPYMKGCLGPMPYEQAWGERVKIWDARKKGA